MSKSPMVKISVVCIKRTIGDLRRYFNTDDESLWRALALATILQCRNQLSGPSAAILQARLMALPMRRASTGLISRASSTSRERMSVSAGVSILVTGWLVEDNL